jgi:hypothetical protein
MEMEVKLHPFLTSALDGNELSVTFTFGVYGVGARQAPELVSM